jgi:uncharacterized protein DUF4271
MLPDSKNYFNYKRQFLTVCILALAVQASAQQLVYDLRQEWVQYNIENQGFLPIDEQDLANKVISFKLAESEFDHFYLSCVVTEKSYLFYGTKLFATIPAGVSNFKIDSLRKALGDSQPFITIYGNKLLPRLITQVRTQPLSKSKVSSFLRIRFANDFSNFFYFGTTIIFLIFVVLKMRFHELADQYLLFQRAVNMKTIDELIYKIPYLGAPNFLFMVFISLVLGFATLSFTYFYPEEILFLEINAGVSSFGYLILHWLEISALILALIVFKYLVTKAITSLFGLNIASIHFASFLRLLWWFSFLLVFLVLTQYFVIGWLSLNTFLIIIVLVVLSMQFILFFKLSLVTTHTLLYIIVYLCATEIIPILILFKILTS